MITIKNIIFFRKITIFIMIWNYIKEIFFKTLIAAYETIWVVFDKRITLYTFLNQLFLKIGTDIQKVVWPFLSRLDVEFKYFFRILIASLYQSDWLKKDG